MILNPPTATERTATDDILTTYHEFHGFRGLDIDADVFLPLHHVAYESHFPTEIQYPARFD